MTLTYRLKVLDDMYNERVKAMADKHDGYIHMRYRITIEIDTSVDQSRVNSIVNTVTPEFEKVAQLFDPLSKVVYVSSEIVKEQHSLDL